MIFLALAVAIASIAVFAAGYALAVLVTRPAPVSPGPTTMELGSEPPALVNLICNRWRLNVDAAEATLLDLAARRYLEFQQLDEDPRKTTVHIVTSPPPVEQLTSYERQVYDRVRQLAVNGVVPLTALVFRDADRAKSWTKRLHQEMIKDARASGLSRRRFSPALLSALITLSGISGAGIGLATLLYMTATEDVDLGAAAGVGVVAFSLFSGLVGAQRSERDTPAGREAASRWLGVRQWLREHDEFASLPPAAVGVWDRYLPYGAALGVTTTASRILDLGLGDKKRVWSSYTGNWRRVRISYPRLLWKYGATAPKLLLRAAGTGFFGWLLLRLGWWGMQTSGTWTDQLSNTLSSLANNVALPLGALLLFFAGYLVLRTVIDLVTPLTFTGEVLWRETWRHKEHNNRRVPAFDHLAVDDGQHDRIRAWVMPTDLHSCRAGDVVTVTVRRWSRRVVRVESARSEQPTAAVPSPSASSPSVPPPSASSSSVPPPPSSVPPPPSSVPPPPSSVPPPPPPLPPMFLPPQATEPSPSAPLPVVPPPPLPPPPSAIPPPPPPTAIPPPPATPPSAVPPPPSAPPASLSPPPPVPPTSVPPPPSHPGGDTDLNRPPASPAR